jgi:WD40 repeat protein
MERTARFVAILLVVGFGFTAAAAAAPAIRRARRPTAPLTTQSPDKPDLVWMAGAHNAGTRTTHSPRGDYFASGGADRTVKLWRLPEYGLIRTLVGHNSSINALSFSPNGRVLASCSTDGARVWSVPEGGLLASFPGDTYTVAFSPDGGGFAAAGVDGVIRLYETASWQFVGSLSGHAGAVFSVAFSPDGLVLASGGADALVREWRLADGAVLRTFGDHEAEALQVGYSADGTRLI